MKINRKSLGGHLMTLPRQILRVMTTSSVFRERSHHSLNQFQRVMKLTMLLMTFCLLQVSALTKAQVFLTAKGEPLQKVLKSVSRQSGYDFVFDLKLMEKAKAVNISLSNASLEEALRSCFLNQDFTYTSEDMAVIVKEKTIFDKVTNYFDGIDVVGVVLDENGQPMAGVLVKVKGTNRVTVTGPSGHYYIATERDNQMLIFSYVGYKTSEIMAKAKLDITMVLDPAKLDEVLVIGYGTTTRRLSTGSQVGITAKDIEKPP